MNEQPARDPDRFHVEWFFGDRLGQPILVRCWCGIGHDHTYADWVARYHAEAEAETSAGSAKRRPTTRQVAPSAQSASTGAA